MRVLKLFEEGFRCLIEDLQFQEGAEVMQTTQAPM